MTIQEYGVYVPNPLLTGSIAAIAIASRKFWSAEAKTERQEKKLRLAVKYIGRPKIGNIPL